MLSIGKIYHIKFLRQLGGEFLIMIILLKEGFHLLGGVVCAGVVGR
jgi:hypothetical protein